MTQALLTNRLLPRREFLWRFGGGLGGIALTHLLAEQGLLADVIGRGRPEFNGGLHHPARAKRVIQLFMNGGASQIDTFDYKPELTKISGQKASASPASCASIRRPVRPMGEQRFAGNC